MLGFILAGLTAVFASFQDVLSKLCLKRVDEYILAWVIRLFVFLFLIPLLFFIKIPTLGHKFWLALLFCGILNTIATILYLKALKASDLSLTVPMLTFTPLFLLVTSPLMVKEFPSAFGTIGIFLIVIGSYLLNLKQKEQGFLAPFKALLKEKGPRLMLIVAFIYSIASNFDKIGIQNSSPIFWVIAANGFYSLCILPLMFYKARDKLYQIPKNFRIFAVMCIFGCISLICQMTAFSLTLVAYVIAIKRTSAILTVFFGYLLFKEKGLKERLAGTIVMVLGVAVISLFP